MADVLTSYDGSHSAFATVGTGNSRFAQSFKIPAGKRITGFSLKACKASGSSISNFTVQIYEGSSAPEAGTKIAEQTFSADSLGSYTTSPSFHDFTFTTPTGSLTGGTSTSYYIVVLADSSGNLSWSYSWVSPLYSDGCYWFRQYDSDFSRWEWNSGTSYDFSFKIWGEDAGKTAVVSDSLTLAESNTNLRSLLSEISDAIGLTGTVETLKVILVEAFDSFTLSGTVSSIKSHVADLLDSIDLVETISSIRAMITEVCDSLTLTEMAASLKAFVVEVFDSIGLTDTLSALRGLVVDILEALGITGLISVTKPSDSLPVIGIPIDFQKADIGVFLQKAEISISLQRADINIDIKGSAQNVNL